MKDDFTSAMHDELTIDAATQLKHKAICVRKLLGSSYTQEELETYCNLYGITTEQFHSIHPIIPSI